jgi:hypothetical protein
MHHKYWVLKWVRLDIWRQNKRVGHAVASSTGVTRKAKVLSSEVLSLASWFGDRVWPGYIKAILCLKTQMSAGVSTLWRRFSGTAVSDLQSKFVGSRGEIICGHLARASGSTYFRELETPAGSFEGTWNGKGEPNNSLNFLVYNIELICLLPTSVSERSSTMAETRR